MLKEHSYWTYKRTWKQLLCFVYRVAYKREQQPPLHYILTNEQSAALEHAITVIQAVADKKQQLLFLGQSDNESVLKFWASADRACLELCISLLDQRLMGNIYESIFVGFLAVLGINSAKDGFQEAATYTSHLSAVIKIAQLLVIQRAVSAAELGETEYPAQMIETLQSRFMTYGSRSPIN